jgi:hypothetical protein
LLLGAKHLFVAAKPLEQECQNACAATAQSSENAIADEGIRRTLLREACRAMKWVMVITAVLVLAMPSGAGAQSNPCASM